MIPALLLLLGAVAVIALIVGLSACLNGWVLTKLWGWFIVPVFGLPALSLAPAIGVALVVHYLTYQHINAAKDEDAKWWAGLLSIVCRPLIVLCFGAVVHCFI